MNYLRPERLDALARAHALGTLSPRAARRFARVVASSADAARAVAEWQGLLSALEEGAPGSPAPRPRVWDAVQQRLFERDAPARAGAGVSRGAFAGAGWLRWPIGLVLGASLMWTTLAWRPQTFGVEPASGAAPATYVGVLQDPQGRPLLATSARRHGLVLTVRLLRPVAPAPGQVLTVWAWNDADPTPHRVGQWPGGGQTAEIALPAQAESLLGTMTHLGLSIESASAVPAAPAHPFIAEGPCAKVW